MIPEAYLYFADGRAHALSAEISVGVEGGPDWMKSERYIVEAKTGQTPPAAVMRGPMLQAILEDRFKLKVRRVTREMPVYELVIAKSGAKVSPYTGHDCDQGRQSGRPSHSRQASVTVGTERQWTGIGSSTRAS